MCLYGLQGHRKRRLGRCEIQDNDSNTVSAAAVVPTGIHGHDHVVDLFLGCENANIRPEALGRWNHRLRLKTEIVQTVPLIRSEYPELARPWQKVLCQSYVRTDLLGGKALPEIHGVRYPILEPDHRCWLSAEGVGCVGVKVDLVSDARLN